MKRNIWVIGIAAVFAASASASIIVDNFEVDSSANYTIVDDGTPDGIRDFQFDYIAAGIPLAPNSTGGDSLGLRFTSNDTLGAADHVTAFHNTPISGYANYTMTVDMYIAVGATSGTTEMAHVGIGSDGSTFNSIFTPINGEGQFISITGDGGSASDYRHYLPPGNPVPSGDPSYLNDLNTTNATGDTYQNLFPNTDYPGSPGNIWTTLEIDVAGGIVTYSLDGTPIIQTTAVAVDGLVSLGYNDLFTSVASPLQSNFVVYDNLVVTPEPASLALLALGGVALIRRRR